LPPGSAVDLVVNGDVLAYPVARPGGAGEQGR
jgi:hypothetical protein